MEKLIYDITNEQRMYRSVLTYQISKDVTAIEIVNDANTIWVKSDERLEKVDTEKYKNDGIQTIVFNIK